jgi:NADH:ubiquinone oxidoreductase subunit 6 (subunit J)
MAIPPETASAAAVADPTARFAAVEEQASKSADAVRSATNIDDFDRSFIARTIMYVYAGAIVVGFLFLTVLAGFAWFTAADDWKAIAADAVDIIKTAVLPIVTLVLGYYFGKSKS